MSYEAWFTLFVLIITIFIVFFEFYDLDVALLSAAILLVIGNIISVEQAIAGFSNESVLSIAMLFVVSAGIQYTGAMENIMSFFFVRPGQSFKVSLAKILAPTCLISGVFNDTPLVALLIPIARRWCRKHGISIARVLMPISFSALLGGMLTLVGTSNNLFVSGLMVNSGLEPLGYFELTPYAAVISFFGILFLILFSSKGNFTTSEQETGAEETKEFICITKVEADYLNRGKTVEEAGLRHLKGLFLFQIIRDSNEVLAPVSPNVRIQEGDRLFFTGIPNTIVEIQSTPGLSIIDDLEFRPGHYDSELIRSFEVVVSPSSPLINQKVKSSNFRSKYDAAILAIHRNGQRINQKIGDIVFRAGDTLLLLAKNDFLVTWKNSPHFYLVSEGEEILGKPKGKTRIALGLFVLFVGLLLSQKLPLFSVASLIGLLMIVTGCVTSTNARRSVELKVLVAIAASLALAKGIQTSGLAGHMADFFLMIFPFATGLLALMTITFGMMISLSLALNTKAAASLVFPIMIAMCQKTGVEARPIALVIVIAASTAFLTPVAYQTNLLVAGPGGYKTRDFLRIGIPLTAIVVTISTILIYLKFRT